MRKYFISVIFLYTLYTAATMSAAALTAAAAAANCKLLGTVWTVINFTKNLKWSGNQMK